MLMNDGTVRGGAIMAYDAGPLSSQVHTFSGGLGWITDYRLAPDWLDDAVATDVAGVWRRDRTAGRPKWVPQDSPAYGFNTIGQRGVAVAIAKSDPTRRYVMVGVAEGTKVVSRSNDRGQTWVACAGLTSVAGRDPNYGAERRTASQLEVDPRNKDHILVAAPGTASTGVTFAVNPQGVWHSRDGGATAALITGVPATARPTSSYSPQYLVEFIPSTPAVSGRTDQAYIFVQGVGAYRVSGLSSATYVVTNLSMPNGNTVQPVCMIVDSAGRLIIGDDLERNVAGLDIYTPGSGWTTAAHEFNAETITENPLNPGQFLMWGEPQRGKLLNSSFAETYRWDFTREFFADARPTRTFIGPDRITDEGGTIYPSNARSYENVGGLDSTIFFPNGVGLLRTTWSEVILASTQNRPPVLLDDTYGQEMLVNNIPAVLRVGSGKEIRIGVSHDKAIIPHTEDGGVHNCALRTIPSGFYHGLNINQSTSNPDFIASLVAAGVGGGTPGCFFSTDGLVTFQKTPNNPAITFSGGDAVPLNAGQILVRPNQGQWPQMTLDGGNTWNNIELRNTANAVVPFAASPGGLGFFNWTVQAQRAKPHPTKPGRAVIWFADNPSVYEGLWENRPNTLIFDQMAGTEVNGQRVEQSVAGYHGHFAIDPNGYLYACGGNISNFEVQDATVHLARFNTNTSPYSERTVTGTWWNEMHWVAVGAPVPGTTEPTIWGVGFKNNVNVLAFNRNRGDGDWQIALNLPNYSNQVLKALAMSPTTFGTGVLAINSLGAFSFSWGIAG